jgi:hypothetical protein
MTYRPVFRKQLGDPTTWLDPYICTLESGAMALDFHTKGGIKVWGGQLVPWCGLTPAQIAGQAPRADGEVRTGSGIPNVSMAWKHWNQTLGNRIGYRWISVLESLQLGRAVILQGDYDQFSLATRCQDAFLGNHAVIVLPERMAGPKWLVGDPLCSGYKWVSELELYRYAMKLGFNGQLYFAVTDVETAGSSGLPDTATEEPDEMGFTVETSTTGYIAKPKMGVPVYDIPGAEEPHRRRNTSAGSDTTWLTVGWVRGKDNRRWLCRVGGDGVFEFIREADVLTPPAAPAPPGAKPLGPGIWQVT